jgi:hypothetical protein
MIKIDVPLYNSDVYLLIENNCLLATKRINNEHNNLTKINEENDSRGFVWETTYLKENKVEKKRFYIYVEKNDLSTTLEHEVIHLSFNILEHVGITINYDCQEPLTYLFEYLLTECKKHIKLS